MIIMLQWARVRFAHINCVAAASNRYGWYAATPEEKSEVKPKKSCEETLFAAEMIKSGLF